MRFPDILFSDISGEFKEIVDCWDRALNDRGSFRWLRTVLRRANWIKLPNGLIALSRSLDSKGLSMTEWLFHAIKNPTIQPTACRDDTVKKYQIQCDPDSAYTRVRRTLNDAVNIDIELMPLLIDPALAHTRQRTRRIPEGQKNMVILSAKIWFRMYVRNHRRRETSQMLQTTTKKPDSRRYIGWSELDEIFHSFHMFKRYLTEPVEGYNTRGQIRTFKEKDCRAILRLILNDECSIHDLLGSVLADQAVNLEVVEVVDMDSGLIKIIKNRKQVRYTVISDNMAATTAYHNSVRSRWPSPFDSPENTQQGLVKAGFNFFNIDAGINTWEFPMALAALDNKLKEFSDRLKCDQDELGLFAKDTSMMIFVGFLTHGVQGHIMDNADICVEYKEILKLLNKYPNLSSTQKVGLLCSLLHCCRIWNH